MHGNSWVIINAWAEYELANIIPQNVPSTRVVPVQMRRYSFTSAGTQLTWNVFGWEIGVSTENYVPRLPIYMVTICSGPPSTCSSTTKQFKKSLAEYWFHPKSRKSKTIGPEQFSEQRGRGALDCLPANTTLKETYGYEALGSQQRNKTIWSKWVQESALT